MMMNVNREKDEIKRKNEIKKVEEMQKLQEKMNETMKTSYSTAKENVKLRKELDVDIDSMDDSFEKYKLIYERAKVGGFEPFVDKSFPNNEKCLGSDISQRTKVK